LKAAKNLMKSLSQGEENYKMVFIKRDMTPMKREQDANYESSWHRRRDWRQREAKQPTGLYEEEK